MSDPEFTRDEAERIVDLIEAELRRTTAARSATIRFNEQNRLDDVAREWIALLDHVYTLPWKTDE